MFEGSSKVWRFRNVVIRVQISFLLWVRIPSNLSKWIRVHAKSNSKHWSNWKHRIQPSFSLTVHRLLGSGHWAEPVHRPNEPDPVRVRDSQLFLPPCRQQGQATTHQLTPVAPPIGPSSDLVLMYFLRGFSPLISSSTAARLWEHFDGHGEIFCIFFLNQKVDHDYSTSLSWNAFPIFSPLKFGLSRVVL